MDITSRNITAFMTELDETLSSLEKKYDVTITFERITYSEDKFSTKMTVNNSRDIDLINEHNFDAEVWKYEDYGLKKGMYRQMFLSRNSERCAILGFIPNAKKYPLHIVRFSDGQHFKVSPSFIREFLPGKYYENRKDEKD